MQCHGANQTFELLSVPQSSFKLKKRLELILVQERSSASDSLIRSRGKHAGFLKDFSIHERIHVGVTKKKTL